MPSSIPHASARIDLTAANFAFSLRQVSNIIFQICECRSRNQRSGVERDVWESVNQQALGHFDFDGEDVDGFKGLTYDS